MSSVFNADDDRGAPFFGCGVYPPRLLFNRWHTEAHVPGRHLNALLSAEDGVGVEIDEEAVDQHWRAAVFSYSGPVAMPLNRSEIGGPLATLSSHNLREGFHALYAMARFRRSDQAAALAAASIDAIFELWHPERGWDLDCLQTKLGLEVLLPETIVMGLARAIGPLVKLYRSTGLAKALELALVLKEKVIGEFFREDGGYEPQLFGTHTHSTTCVMSSLAQLADLTSDHSLMDRVRVFYDNGLWSIRNELGWVIENGGDDAEPELGEVNNTGDIVETALILGSWGYPQYYGDAERILRSHLLPSQLRDTSFIVEPTTPNRGDGERNLADRCRGGFGFPAPYGHWPAGVEPRRVGFNMDIVGGSVGSLAAAYAHIIRTNRAGVWVNLLFDRETSAAAVESPYGRDGLRIRMKVQRPLFVRLPSWTDVAAVRIEGASGTTRRTNGYVFFAAPPVNRWIEMRFPLVEREIAMRHRTRDIRVRLRGDEVVAMDNFGADLTYYEPFD